MIDFASITACVRLAARGHSTCRGDVDVSFAYRTADFRVPTERTTDDRGSGKTVAFHENTHIDGAFEFRYEVCRQVNLGGTTAPFGRR